MTNEIHNTNPVASKPRRWFRFRLRTLLVMVTLLSVPFGWELNPRRREQKVGDWVEKMGGIVNLYHSNSLLNERSWWEKKKDKWFGERVRDVFFLEKKVIDLSPLAELKKLEKLLLTHSNEEQAQERRLALPNCAIRY